MKQIVITVAVVLVVVLGAYLLVKPTNAPQTTPTVEVAPTSAPMTETPQATESPTPEENVATESPSPAAEGVSVTLANLKFTPSSLTIKAGKNYKLTLVSKGPHTYTIDKLGINFVVASGETKVFDLKVDKKGTYDVHCATPGHTEAGMVGKLIVN